MPEDHSNCKKNLTFVVSIEHPEPHAAVTQITKTLTSGAISNTLLKNMTPAGSRPIASTLAQLDCTLSTGAGMSKTKGFCSKRYSAGTRSIGGDLEILKLGVPRGIILCVFLSNLCSSSKSSAALAVAISLDWGGSIASVARSLGKATAGQCSTASSTWKERPPIQARRRNPPHQSSCGVSSSRHR